MSEGRQLAAFRHKWLNFLLWISRNIRGKDLVPVTNLSYLFDHSGTLFVWQGQNRTSVGREK
ncbi:hypothetical protein BKC07_22415 [Peribacillus simplex]|nr:hypothetical protein BKC07_22415 [Peribacillus simplex]